MKKIAFLAAVVIALYTGCATSDANVWKGTLYGGADKSYDTDLLQLREEIAPRFQSFVFEDEVTGRALRYNLFIPEQYDEKESYPLVLFLHDGSVVNKEPAGPLMQGYGAIIWATDSSQAKNPSFVLAPAYSGPEAVVNDNWQLSDEMAVTERLLDYVVNGYSIDTNRLYITGQSMGCMMSFYLNITHPDVFAASLYVGGQWDINVLSPLKDQKFFYVVSEGDQKAFPAMNDLGLLLKKEGASIGITQFSANLPLAEQNTSIQDLIKQGQSINFVVFNKGTVKLPDFKPEQSSFFVEHMYSFDHAYLLESVRNWLFEQTLSA